MTIIPGNRTLTKELLDGNDDRRAARLHALRHAPAPEESKLPDHWEEVMAAARLGSLAQVLIEDRDFWLLRSKGETYLRDTDEIKTLSGQVAAALGPVIGAVMEAKKRHEALAEEIKKGARS